MIALVMTLAAQAWDHTYDVWKLRDEPVRVIVDPTMPDAEEWLAAFQNAADAWTDTPTMLALSVEMAESGPLSYQSSPGRIAVYGDLTGALGASAASTELFSNGAAYEDSHDIWYNYLDEADIIVSATATFVGIDEPCEGDEDIREIVAMHELGHALGLRDLCEYDDTFGCPEPEASAVMYWDDTGCTANATPNVDDLDGLGALYDAAGWWSITSGGEIGETPREVCFATLPNDVDADHVAWDFGDESTGDGETICHTFETPGEFDVEVRYFSEPDDDAPRWWTQSMIACPSPPGPTAGAEHLFDVDAIGTQIQILPTVDAWPPCVTSVRWSVLRKGETLYDLPVSKSLVDVGEYGEYTVALRTDGPFGGVGEEERTVTLALSRRRRTRLPLEVR
jgi:hypothetical protein